MDDVHPTAARLAKLRGDAFGMAVAHHVHPHTLTHAQRAGGLPQTTGRHGEPAVSALLRCCSGIARVLLPWLSLRYPLGSSWVAGALSRGLRWSQGASTEPSSDFDSISLAAIQTEAHFSKTLLRSAVLHPCQTILRFLHSDF